MLKRQDQSNRCLDGTFKKLDFYCSEDTVTKSSWDCYCSAHTVTKSSNDFFYSAFTGIKFFNTATFR